MSISTALDRWYHAHIDHTLCGQEFDKPIASCVKSEQGQWDIVGFQVISLHKTRISYLIHSKSDIHEQKEAQHAYFLEKKVAHLHASYWATASFAHKGCGQFTKR